jgi:hypothetical protein
MPANVKRRVELGRSGFYRFLIVLAILTFSFFSAALITTLGLLESSEAAVVMGALAVLTLAFLWSVGEVRRLNRD